MKTKKLFVNTMGCQMNVYDSEKVASVLARLGFEKTSVLEEADLVVVNTCTIREKAEQKAFSFLGRLAKLKRKKTDLVVAVGGCVAQQEGEAILKRVPSVDLVFGTRAIGRVAEHVARIERQGVKIVDVEMTDAPVRTEPDAPISSNGQVSSFVTIMTGCENYCTYCVVPSVRGKEISRRPESIVGEIESLVCSGVREVVLLGQNVNSYGIKQGYCSFAELIGMVDRVEGLERIRFTTSHPKDLSEELMGAFAKYEKLCGHFHLPVQSGSDRILKRMNRGYTKEIYMKKVEGLRRVRPHIALSTDIIVGFPGESEEDFEQTLDLIEKASYDSLFAFKYSDRPSAPARKFSGKVPESVKTQRLRRVLESQEDRTTARHRSLIGTVLRVLVEGPSKKQRAGGADLDVVQWSGRTETNIVVNIMLDESTSVRPDENLTGRSVDVKIDGAFPHSIWGKPVAEGTETPIAKGETYAA